MSRHHEAADELLKNTTANTDTDKLLAAIGYALLAVAERVDEIARVI